MLNYEATPEATAALRQRTPPGTALDAWQGRVLVSVVGFLFLDTRLLGIPIPFHRNFEELNLRFYVTRRCAGESRRGVVFIKEIVPLKAVAAVARACYGERYSAMAMRHEISPSLPSSHSIGSAIYEWRHGKSWGRLGAQYSGEPTLPVPGSEEEFVTEHYWGYALQRNAVTLEYRVTHPQWRVWQASQTEFQCDAAALYGPEFAETLSRRPSSAFVAEGSPVSVHPGMRITRPH
jgi:uncharacterized protein YqjF (DUF2071 family)